MRHASARVALLLVVVCAVAGAIIGWNWAAPRVPDSPTMTKVEQLALTQGLKEYQAETGTIETGEQAAAAMEKRSQLAAQVLWAKGIPASTLEKGTVALYGAIAGIILGAVGAPILAWPISLAGQKRKMAARRVRFARCA